MEVSRAFSSGSVLAIPTWLMIQRAKIRWDAVDPGGF